MKKVLAVLLALAMVLGIAVTVQAEPPTFSISIEAVTGGPGSDPANNTYTNPISLTGNASATHFPGHVSQYQVQIDWGDGMVDTDSNVNFTISESGLDFAGTWTSDPSHVYANGAYIINAKLYHQQPPGNEAGDAQATPILIVVVNTPPVAANDSATTDEDIPVTIDVLANDYDVDGDPLTVVSVTQGSNGSVANNVANVTYSPNANWYGIDTFTYTASDGNGSSNTATVIVTVSAVNDNPVAADDSATTDEDIPVTIDVLANDYDVEGDPLTVASVTQGSNGSVANNGADVTYSPNANWYGIDTFTYTADDGNGGTDTATVTVTVNAINNPPVAVDDSATTDEDTPVTIDVLANDYDVEGDFLTLTSVTQGSNGSVVNNGADVTYSPNANWYGIDTFTYTADDGNGGTDTATVTVTVNAVNDMPVAVDDAYSIDEDTTLNVPAPGVLDNDYDVDLDALAAVLVSNVTNGTLALNADGSFSYTPNADFNGADSFTYKANDGTADSNVATVTITVNPVNDAPVAMDDSTTTDEDTPVTIDVLANDYDVDGDLLTVAWVTQGGNGSVVNNGADVTYSPNANWYGIDTFTYTAGDVNGGTDTATVTVTVNAVNDMPVAVDDAYSIDEDTTLNVPAPGVLDNDYDVDLDALAAVLVSSVTNGTLALNADGSFSYTPNADFNGSDSFTYKANDGTADSNIATVTITVNPVTNGGGGGISIGRRYLTVDFEGEITRGLITYDGRLLVDLAAPSPDGMHWLELDKGTTTLDSEGEVVTLIEIREVEAPSSFPNTVLVGNAYDFGPSNITFDQPVRLTLSYNVTDLPEDTLDVVMAYYDPAGAWTEVETESSQVAEIGSLTGTTDHFTVFAMFAAVPNFQVTDLSIVPSQREIWSFPTFVVRTGEEALISINVINNANREATYTATLLVDGEISATREVTLDPGQSKVVVFTLSGNEPGRYSIVVDSLSGELTSSVWINWWLIGIIIGALLLIILFTVWSYRRRGKTAE